MSLVLLVPVVILDFVGHEWPAADGSTGGCHGAASFTLAGRFYCAAPARLGTARPNMDTLVTIGTWAAYGAGASLA